LPDEPSFFSSSHWCLETLGAGGDVTNAEEFSATD
jgi:hypothetical protein